VWCCTSVIPVLGRITQKDHKFEASLGYTVRLCLKKGRRKKKGLISITRKAPEKSKLKEILQKLLAFQKHQDPESQGLSRLEKTKKT
jgi:hypothetical protein